MGNCGEEHGAMCTEVTSHKDQISQLWDSRLATKTFVWASVIVGFTLTLLIGWTTANNGKLSEVERTVAVVSERMCNVQEQAKQNRDVTIDGFNKIHETMLDLRKDIRKRNQE